MCLKDGDKTRLANMADFAFDGSSGFFSPSISKKDLRFVLVLVGSSPIVSSVTVQSSVEYHHLGKYHNDDVNHTIGNSSALSFASR